MTAVQGQRSTSSSDELLARLIGAHDEAQIPEIVAPLTSAQRAGLAVFCYGRSHLQNIGLAIAATCDESSLIRAAPSNEAGFVIFTWSRNRSTLNGFDRRSRPRVTLATSASGNAGLA